MKAFIIIILFSSWIIADIACASSFERCKQCLTESRATAVDYCRLLCVSQKMRGDNRPAHYKSMTEEQLHRSKKIESCKQECCDYTGLICGMFAIPAGICNMRCAVAGFEAMFGKVYPDRMCETFAPDVNPHELRCTSLAHEHSLAETCFEMPFLLFFLASTAYTCFSCSDCANKGGLEAKQRVREIDAELRSRKFLKKED